MAGCDVSSLEACEIRFLNEHQVSEMVHARRTYLSGARSTSSPTIRGLREPFELLATLNYVVPE